MKAIDLFCGCGGLAAGLRDAGFDILAGVDLEPNYLQTFRHNFPDALAVCGDATELQPRALMTRLGLQTGELDLLAGGPPCQGFSKNVPRSQRQLDGKNNVLVATFLEYCEVLLPRWVLMENVAEMRNGFDRFYTDEIVRRLTEVGYQVTHGVHNAADFGVPQRRKRAFFVARRDGIPPGAPAATHTAAPATDLLAELCPYVTVWEAISDLRPLEHGAGAPQDEYYQPAQNSYQEYARSGSQHVFNHVAKALKTTQFERISSLQPGQGIKDLPDHLRPKGGYSGAYGRLTKDMVMPTITRWVFHVGSGRWGHPVDRRLITIREAARLHGYRDSFRFYGTYVQQSGQLGNSVPPLLAKTIGQTLLQA